MKKSLVAKPVKAQLNLEPLKGIFEKALGRKNNKKDK